MGGRCRGLRGFAPPASVFDGGSDETGEQRLGGDRLGLELGVVLHGQEPRMVRHFHHLDQTAVGARAAEPEAVGFVTVGGTGC